MLEPRRGADLAHETQGLGEPGEQLGRDGGPAISRWKRALPHLLVRVRGKRILTISRRYDTPPTPENAGEL